MMQRREFLRRASLIAAGVVAADQLDVLEMLAPRRLFAGADFATSRRLVRLRDQHGREWSATTGYSDGVHFTDAGFRKIVEHMQRIVGQQTYGIPS